MTDCIFCKIASGEIPAEKTYEDDQFVAFLDIKPVAPGHTLLIPRAHHQWFYELPSELYDELFRTAKKLALKLKDETGADYVKLSIVGVDIAHVHLHLIPRMFADRDTHP